MNSARRTLLANSAAMLAAPFASISIPDFVKPTTRPSRRLFYQGAVLRYEGDCQLTFVFMLHTEASWERLKAKEPYLANNCSVVRFTDRIIAIVTTNSVERLRRFGLPEGTGFLASYPGDLPWMREQWDWLHSGAAQRLLRP